jgi:hypothetical protein
VFIDKHGIKKTILKRASDANEILYDSINVLSYQLHKHICRERDRLTVYNV